MVKNEMKRIFIIIFIQYGLTNSKDVMKVIEKWNIFELNQESTQTFEFSKV
jgi:hypothetical protein